VPTRRIFELVIITNMLFWPARSTVKLWGRKQLAVRQPGTALHGAGEVIVTIL
jgi:hypothetical protein